ncbi:GAF domain-containing protein [Archangium gephyra]|uniref:Diguanylate cyclase/phosphodiesterase n=1 Tax=Archangium gephyra TaxID=48 RepID=A0AAC8Q981_9BACT|nr:GAF domain-containing protein [Archangium gephyra]AKJ03189.1 diguanylate cyclase/phosphodiesterase [Archangium gephyra]REG22936.1 GAF domain-containing protein [Archangium gephyra]
MSFVPPQDMSVLDDAGRLASFEAPLLDSTPDPELQALVAEATALTGFPIGLVSLVVRKIQFFRAQVGLPPDLSATLATDRCTSFCQFVVARGEGLRIEDATREPGLPRDLVERYGIRAYVGFPLTVQGRTVGSFCVIDAKPARLEAGVLTKLEELARRASARLEEMVRQVPASTSSSEAEAQARNAWLAVAEAQPLLSLSERFADGQLSFEEFQRGIGALAGLTDSSG